MGLPCLRFFAQMHFKLVRDALLRPKSLAKNKGSHHEEPPNPHHEGQHERRLLASHLVALWICFWASDQRNTFRDNGDSNWLSTPTKGLRNTSLWSFITNYHTPGAPLVVGSLEYFTANINNWAVKKHKDPVKRTFLRTNILFDTIFDINIQTF